MNFNFYFFNQFEKIEKLIVKKSYMEDYLNQLYENINDKHKEYNKMLEQHFMDIFNIKKDQLKYLKDYFEYDDFIIVNNVIKSTNDITKLDREYIKFNVTNLNLKPRYENLFGDCSTYDLFIKFDSTIHSFKYWYNFVEIKKYFIHTCESDDYDFVLVLDDKTINKLISILEISINKTIDINDIQKIEILN